MFKIKDSYSNYLPAEKEAFVYNKIHLNKLCRIMLCLFLQVDSDLCGTENVNQKAVKLPIHRNLY